MADPTVNWHVFESRDAMVAALKAVTTEQLLKGLLKNGKASWAVSGGSTPAPLFEAMSREGLDWSRIQVALVDERWVDAAHPRSNEAFMKGALAKGHSAKARFVGMKTPHDSPSEAVEAVNDRFSAVAQPFDSILLGMGPDGHTASFFPAAQGLEEAMDPGGNKICVALTANRSDVTGDEVDRMSLSVPTIVAAKQVVLMITGDEKKRVLEEALDPSSNLPIGRLARLTPIDVYWAP